MFIQDRLLDAARAALPGIAPRTDYRLAKHLGLTSAHISAMRKQRTVMSPELAVRMAELAGWEAGAVLPLIERERVMMTKPEAGLSNAQQALIRVYCRMAEMYPDFRNSETKKTGGKVATLVGAAILSLLIQAPQPVQASTYARSADVVHGDRLYIMRSRKRRKGQRRVPLFTRFRQRITARGPLAA
jgi:plasmid maintenance system antidote protein VapI